MVDSLHRIRVLVSSSDEMQSLASIVTAVARELSPIFEDTRSLTLKVLDWRFDAAPGIDSDPQARLNAQLRYDLYIGLLGSRFGTPTPRAGSGTEDEFNGAYERYTENSKAVRLLFYFKKDLADIHSADLEQLQKVVEFRRKLSKLGVLYGDYSTSSELEELLRQHLRILFTTDWDSDLGSWKAGRSPQPKRDEQPEPTTGSWTSGSDTSDSSVPVGPIAGNEASRIPEEAPGVLDFAVDLETSAADGVAALTDVGTAAEAFGIALSERASSAQALNLNPATTAKQKQQLADAAALDMKTFAHALSTGGARFRAAFKSTILSTESGLLAESGESAWDPKVLPDLDNRLEALTEVVRQQREQISQFATLSAQFPSLTRHVRAAKRVVGSSASDFVTVYTEALDQIVALRRRLRQLPGGETLPPL